MNIEAAVEETMELISRTGDNSRELTQQESVEFYEQISAECRDRANTIKEEMGQ